MGTFIIVVKSAESSRSITPYNVASLIAPIRVKSSPSARCALLAAHIFPTMGVKGRSAPVGSASSRASLTSFLQAA